MNTRTLVLVLATAFSTAVTLPALAAEHHSHSHGAHAEAPTRLTLDNGRKWKTDAPLRNGMQEIRAALEGAHGHDRDISPAQYKALGMTLERNIAAIVMNCKLEPAADANLHVIIGELNAAANAFRGDSPAEAEKALQRAARATRDYARYFEHPGFMKATSDASRAPLDLDGAAALIARTYPGRVVAAQADPAAPHYHVDLRLPHGNVVRFDVDRETHRIDNHQPENGDPRSS